MIVIKDDEDENSKRQRECTRGEIGDNYRNLLPLKAQVRIEVHNGVVGSILQNDVERVDD